MKDDKLYEVIDTNDYHFEVVNNDFPQKGHLLNLMALSVLIIITLIIVSILPNNVNKTIFLTLAFTNIGLCISTMVYVYYVARNIMLYDEHDDKDNMEVSTTGYKVDRNFSRIHHKLNRIIKVNGEYKRAYELINLKLSNGSSLFLTIGHDDVVEEINTLFINSDILNKIPKSLSFENVHHLIKLTDGINDVKSLSFIQMELRKSNKSTTGKFE